LKKIPVQYKYNYGSAKKIGVSAYKKDVELKQKFPLFAQASSTKVVIPPDVSPKDSTKLRTKILANG
jgi:hypothetical protein